MRSEGPPDPSPSLRQVTCDPSCALQMLKHDHSKSNPQIHADLKPVYVPGGWAGRRMGFFKVSGEGRE